MAWLHDPNDQWKRYLQDDERIAVYGYLTWVEKEVEQRGKGACMVAATDRRFMMLPINYSRVMSSIPYQLLSGRHSLQKRLFSWYLIFDVNPRTSFAGPKELLRHLNRWIEECIAAGVRPLTKTTVRFVSYPLDVGDLGVEIAEEFLACDSCNQQVSHSAKFCDGCGRVIDWGASADARTTYLQAMRKIGYL